MILTFFYDFHALFQRLRIGVSSVASVLIEAAASAGQEPAAKLLLTLHKAAHFDTSSEDCTASIVRGAAASGSLPWVARAVKVAGGGLKKWKRDITIAAVEAGQFEVPTHFTKFYFQFYELFWFEKENPNSFPDLPPPRTLTATRLGLRKIFGYSRERR